MTEEERRKKLLDLYYEIALHADEIIYSYRFVTKTNVVIKDLCTNNYQGDHKCKDVNS